MKSWKKNLLAIATASIVASPTFLRAAILDLNRITPVPESEAIPVMDFFRPSLLQQPTVNPSGTHIAAVIAAGEDQTSLMVYDLRNQKMETISSRGDSDIRSPQWLTDDQLMYLINVKKLGGFILAGAKVGKLQYSYPILQNIGGYLVAVPPKDRLHPLFAIARGSELTGQDGQVMTLNASLDSGNLLDITQIQFLTGKSLDEANEGNIRHISSRQPVLKVPNGFDTNYIADKEGSLSFGVTSTNGVFTLHHLAGDKWEPCPENLDEIKILGSGDNPGELAVLGERKDGKPRALEVMDGVTGKTVETMFQDKAYDFDGWLYHDPVSHLIVGGVYNRVGPSVVWFSETYRNLQKLVDGLFPGKIVRIIGNDEAGKMVLLSVFSDRQPAIYNWVDLEKHSAGLIKDSAPWIDPKRMQSMNVIKFKTRDGHHLDAYVTMPAGASKQNPPPLVVLPHASSDWRDTWGFNSEVQFLASRGYAVLQPNYRGSAGSSWMFPTEDEWAFRKMHDDVTDATKAMIASGLVDPKRIAIMGTSFGGFLALEGAAYEPDLYRCAVAISAVADWRKVINDYRYNKYSNAYFSRMVYKLGDPSSDPEKWDAISPLHNADKIRAAVFIANGEYDSPIAVTCSKDLASIVSHNNIPVETVSFQDEAEGVRHLQHKVELYTRIEAFLAKNLAPKS